MKHVLTLKLRRACTTALSNFHEAQCAQGPLRAIGSTLTQQPGKNKLAIGLAVRTANAIATAIAATGKCKLAGSAANGAK